MKTDQEKCIKLALAMGWTHEQMRENLYRTCWKSPQGDDWVFPSDLPDPFTDANADYAVLEWMRNEGKGRYDNFCNALAIILDNDHFNYKIGHYARAALKVIE